MKNGNKENPNVMRKALLLAVFLSLVTVTTFSLQLIYSSGIRVETSETYGVYQNNVFKDTKDVLVPSAFAVKKITLLVQNSQGASRNIFLSVDYSGTVQDTAPAAEASGNILKWELELLPYEETSIEIIGKELSIGTPIVSVKTAEPQNISNKTLTVSNASNETAKPEPTVFSAEEGSEDILGPILEEPRKLDLVAKSVLTIFAGLVILTIASGFAFVFGKEELPRMQRKAKIHIGDMYHETDADSAKYQYEENKYWEEK